MPYIFATKEPSPNGRELGIYNSPQWDGAYKLYQTVILKDNTARGAGDLFQIGNTWIRPAQDCNHGYYGRGLILQEVLYQNNAFSFREIKRFYPASKESNAGIHTLNVFKGTIVVDGKQYYYPFIAKLLTGIKALAVRLLNIRSIFYGVQDEIFFNS
jgi:hypothetical protein